MKAVEVIIFQVGQRYAWALRLTNGDKRTIAEGTQERFMQAAAEAAFAEFAYYHDPGPQLVPLIPERASFYERGLTMLARREFEDCEAARKEFDASEPTMTVVTPMGELK